MIDRDFWLEHDRQRRARAISRDFRAIFGGLLFGLVAAGVLIWRALS